MALTLEKGTNTFATLAEAETYMEGRYDSTGLWAAASDATKNQLLVTATRQICDLPWRWSKTSRDQALAFPRNGEEDIEDEVIEATVEQAYYILTASPQPRAQMQGQGVRSMSLGGHSESVGGGGVFPLCGEARRKLGAWMCFGAAIY